MMNQAAKLQQDLAQKENSIKLQVKRDITEVLTNEHN